MKTNAQIEKLKDNAPSGTVGIEIAIRFLSTFKPDYDCVTYWTHDKVKRTFNFGNGTIKDLKRYAHNNKSFMLMIWMDETN